jgi:hypothetical protein
MALIKRIYLRRFRSYPLEKVELGNPVYIVGQNGASRVLPPSQATRDTMRKHLMGAAFNYADEFKKLDLKAVSRSGCGDCLRCLNI